MAAWLVTQGDRQFSAQDLAELKRLASELKLGKPLDRPGAVSAEYGASMIVGGVPVGSLEKPCSISWPRLKEPASLPATQREPKQLMVSLPRVDPFKTPSGSQATFRLPMEQLLVKRADGTYGLKTGKIMVPSRFDGGMDIEVNIARLPK